MPTQTPLLFCDDGDWTGPNAPLGVSLPPPFRAPKQPRLAVRCFFWLLSLSVWLGAALLLGLLALVLILDIVYRGRSEPVRPSHYKAFTRHASSYALPQGTYYKDMHV